MPIVFILSLLIFGSVVSALMPTLVGAIAVFGAFAVVRLITGVTEVSVFSINVITLLGMGLAIDYALFVVSRFREELGQQPDPSRASVNAALARTMATAGRTVLFSGLIVAASLASLLLFPQNFLRSMGYGGVAAVLVAMAAALTVLPALLAVLGPRIEWGRMPWRRGSRAQVATRDAEHGAHGAWARVAHSVMRRPVAYLAVIGVALVALGAPFLGAAWGSVDERVLPADSPSRVAADVLAERFGGETASANIVVRGADEGALAAYVGALKRSRVCATSSRSTRKPLTGRPSRLCKRPGRATARQPGRRTSCGRSETPILVRASQRWWADPPRRPSTSSTPSGPTCRGWRSSWLPSCSCCSSSPSARSCCRSRQS